LGVVVLEELAGEFGCQSDLVVSNERGAVRELGMNRPPINALTREFLRELRAGIEGAQQDGTKAIVISGSRGWFSAGFDLPLLVSLGREEVIETWRELYTLLRTIAVSPVPIVAAMTGHAIAGGAVMAIFCDWRVMSAQDHKLGLNEVQVGIQLPPVVLSGLKRLVGSRMAEYLAVTGALLSPQQGLQIGLVDELAELELVGDRAVAWGRRVAGLPEAASLTRRIARADLLELFRNDMDSEEGWFTATWFSTSTQKHIRAAAERLGRSAVRKGE
jgi:Delta3-Delta2-enoyl-CoA isomerase